MLVLSRKTQEKIMIDDEIEITVVDIRGDKVRIGITAPSKINVHRKEIYDSIKIEGKLKDDNKNGLKSRLPNVRRACGANGTPTVSVQSVQTAD